MSPMRRIKNHILTWFYSAADKNIWYAHLFLNTVGRFSTNLRDCKIISIDWLDQSNALGEGKIRSESDQFAFGPRHFTKTYEQREQVKAPEVCWRHFRYAYVNAESSSIIDQTKKMYLERLGRGTQNRFDYSSGSILYYGHNHVIVKLGKKMINHGIFLGGNGSSNYYHWLIEIVPKSQFFKDLPNEYHNYPLLVNAIVKKIPSFVDTLSKISCGRELYYLEPKESYLVRDLLYIDAPNNLPFNLLDNNKFKVSDFLIRDESVAYLRSTFLEPLTSDRRNYVIQKSLPSRVYLARENSRRSFNQNEVEALLCRYGFISIYMESLAFNEQVLLFNNADWIVGPTGAAWTNIVFAKDGARCICWMAEEYGEFSAFSTLAKLVGSNLHYITFETGVESTRTLYNKDYRLNIGLLEQSLVNLGAAPV